MRMFAPAQRQKNKTKQKTISPAAMGTPPTPLVCVTQRNNQVEASFNFIDIYSSLCFIQHKLKTATSDQQY